MSDNAPIVVLGAGLAGWSTVRELRKVGSSEAVLLVSADSADFYAKPSLSNALAQGKVPDQLVTTPAESMAANLQVQLQPHTVVSSIDIEGRQLHSDKGSFAYSRLVLASGAQPIRIPLQGDAAHEVLSVNSLADFRVLYRQLRAGARVLIMGAGLIGCEFANDLALAGYQVQVVDPSERPLAALLPASASAALAEALQKTGVAWHWGSTVQGVSYAAGARSGLQVQLANGLEIHTDIVLSAIGLRASTQLAQAAGLAVDRGIVVDKHVQTSAPDVYALGDGAQYASAGGRTLPFVMPIMHAARSVASALAGNPSPLQFPLMPVAIKTPSYPVVVAPPPTQLPGRWQEAQAGLWQFVDEQGVQRGFVLCGSQTSRRAEQAQRTAV